MKKRTQKKLAAAVAAAVIVAALAIAGNEIITTTRSVYKNSLIPASFSGFKILQVSDLHNKLFGKNQGYLLSEISKLEPDIIVVTGDIIDRRHYNLENAVSFARGAVKIAPVYYVTGNHELWSGRAGEILAALKDAGIILLDGRTAQLERGGEHITIAGIADAGQLQYGDPAPAVDRLTPLLNGGSGFTVLLSHRPWIVEAAAKCGAQLVFAGHLHGGQFRIPFVGGLFSPDDGFFPKHTSGSRTVGGCTVFISRGLGNSVIPLRIFNPPELVLVTLSK